MEEFFEANKGKILKHVMSIIILLLFVIIN